MSPKLSNKKEKRDKVIRIRSYNYDRLARLGTTGEEIEEAEEDASTRKTIRENLKHMV
ncbi:MAG: hypothetical protein M3M91_03800 [Thermoproteota archaeon]|nr:hypothetical protein [Thermoproteota archaeon]